MCQNDPKRKLDGFSVLTLLFVSDLIAIPDFGAGAMENWGLITYRETSLLYSARETSADAKQWIAIVVAHELAHQWFGNLVTMEWWNDLWLNEGFASWMEYRGVDHVQPDWRMMDQFFFDMIAPALKLDSLTTSHPISVEVHDPKEIEAIFDPISYKKVRMRKISKVDFHALMPCRGSTWLTKNNFVGLTTRVSEQWLSLSTRSRWRRPLKIGGNGYWMWRRVVRDFLGLRRTRGIQNVCGVNVTRVREDAERLLVETGEG